MATSAIVSSRTMPQLLPQGTHSHREGPPASLKPHFPRFPNGLPLLPSILLTQRPTIIILLPTISLKPNMSQTPMTSKFPLDLCAPLYFSVFGSLAPTHSWNAFFAWHLGILTPLWAPLPSSWLPLLSSPPASHSLGWHVLGSDPR